MRRERGGERRERGERRREERRGLFTPDTGQKGFWWPFSVGREEITNFPSCGGVREREREREGEREKERSVGWSRKQVALRRYSVG